MTATTHPPVWTPYAPDSVIGEHGWLWMPDGPMGPEWVLVSTVEGEGDTDLWICFADPQALEPSHVAPASGYAGRPYLPVLAPTVEPGKVDLAEAIFLLESGASARFALGDADGLRRAQAALTAIGKRI